MFWTALTKLPYNSLAYTEKLWLFVSHIFGGSEVQDQGGFW